MDRKKIPVLLVTGFLGSGKTTFLNWIIHTHPHLKISLILNEFGDVQLESQFIKEHSGGEIAELANGCMCCVAKSDIPRVIKLILEKSPQTQYIVIEASGLSDPDPIHEALQNPELTDKIRLAKVLCIVDAVSFEKTRGEHAIVMSQVGDADTVILSKVKQAGEQITSRIKSFIESIGIGTKVFLWDDKLDPNLFLNSEESAANVEQKSEEGEHHEHHHEHEKYDEFWFKSDKQIDMDKFLGVMNGLSANIVRSKGYINAADKKIMIQYVPSKLEIFDSGWDNETPNTAVLFLGKNIDTETLKQNLVNCEIH